MDHKFKNDLNHSNSNQNINPDKYQATIYHNLMDNLNQINQEMGDSNVNHQPSFASINKSSVAKHTVHKSSTSNFTNHQSNHVTAQKKPRKKHVFHHHSLAKMPLNGNLLKSLDVFLYAAAIIIIFAALFGIYNAILNIWPTV